MGRVRFCSSGALQLGRSAARQGRRPRRGALGGTVCANRGSHSLSASHRLEHTHNSGEALYRVWASSFFFIFLFLSLSLLLSCVFPSFFLSFSPLGKAICPKTRAKYYHIYIFLFQEGSKGGSVCCVFFFFFPRGKVWVQG